MKYEIDILNDENDEFENNADNVAIVQVHDKEGNDITEKANVQMFLSRNALLGLGTELIRLAHNYSETKHIHIEPAEEDMIVQRMGIFLTPNSTELTILCNDNKVIDDYFKSGEV
ncbi:hypothetical protein [Clostridium gasigenes]|uniref:Uncharacterized protein n=1 Tax=Clostridium gasigenes TaxID=94869 RepID=A0A7X0VTB7_9CLOT|nr:hypothetical protein [Clostridium gasigenes]MBB6716823.1 hypothetical protein [Clostridium gasigenes]